MDFELDDDQALIVQTMRRFAERELRGWATEADRSAAPPPQLARAAADLGLGAEAVPTAVGGVLDGAYGHVARALRGCELARGCAGLAALLESAVEPALAIARWGRPALQQAALPALAGGAQAALLHDSRGALVLADDPGGLRATGDLGPVPALAGAELALVVAADAVFVVRPGGGVAIAPIAPSGWRAARWATLALADAVVPADDILARGAEAAAVGAEILAWANASLAARATGTALAAIEYATAYAAERVQFGQPIGAFEAVIRLRDEALTATLAARWFALHAAWAIDRGRPDAADLASRARVLAGDAVTRATIDAVQIYGGYGFVSDYPVEKLMRDARAFEALHGDQRFARVRAARGGA